LTPSKQEYKEAIEKVKQYEKRQKELKMLNKRLGEHLESFTDFKFIVDRDSGTVFFAGNLFTGSSGGIEIGDDKVFFKYPGTNLVSSTSKAMPNNVFEEIIGKLICVLKAKGMDYKRIYNYIEEKENFYGSISANSIKNGGFIINNSKASTDNFYKGRGKYNEKFKN